MTKECKFLGNVCPEIIVIGLHHKFRAEEENINPNPLRLGKRSKKLFRGKNTGNLLDVKTLLLSIGFWL